MLEKAARRQVEWPERREYERSPVEVGSSFSKHIISPNRCIR